MKNLQQKAFTLVELLVVITILSIISVVAYQNFGWAVDKAVSGRKISDISTIETSLQQFKVDKNYYPAVDEISSTNLWAYNSWTTSTPSNTIDVTYEWEEIKSLDAAAWGWVVYWTWIWAEGVPGTARQIWAKWTISRDTLGKKYLSKDLYDPELWDVKINDTSDTMIDYWVWRYVYATYKKYKASGTWPSNYNWVNYNLAITIKKDWSDTYITKIVWDYDEESCYDDSDKCPTTLIWLEDGSEEDGVSTDTDNWVPYAVTDFE